jgi:hypothetical protein
MPCPFRSTLHLCRSLRTRTRLSGKAVGCGAGWAAVADAATSWPVPRPCALPSFRSGQDFEKAGQLRDREMELKV